MSDEAMKHKDGRLIAAAPELLALLKRLAGCTCADYVYGNKPKTRVCEHDEARALIRRIEGDE